MVEGEKIRALCLKTVRPFRVFCGCINPLDGSNGATSLNCSFATFQAQEYSLA